MNWIIDNVVPPKLRGIWKGKKDIPDDLWIKCPESGQLIFHKDLKDNLYVVPNSSHHMRMSANDRLKMIFDGGQYEEIETIKGINDPLKFKDQKKYADRLKDARSRTEMEDSVIVARGRLNALEIVAAVQDFAFMGGSLGAAAGGALVAGMMKAVERKTPFILFVASGGARMQEGIVSLMQMPRVTVAVQELREARLPYIVVLTNPTMGGVTASYAMLGDIHIAEPGALIGFAGQRVIEQTIREKLPEGFQRAEYLLEHGMVDMVVHRHELRSTLSRLCRLMMHKPVAVDEIPAGLSLKKSAPEVPLEANIDGWPDSSKDQKNGAGEGEKKVAGQPSGNNGVAVPSMQAEKGKPASQSASIRRKKSENSPKNSQKDNSVPSPLPVDGKPDAS